MLLALNFAPSFNLFWDSFKNFNLCLILFKKLFSGLLKADAQQRWTPSLPLFSRSQLLWQKTFPPTIEEITFDPIWLPHWPAWTWTISLITSISHFWFREKRKTDLKSTFQSDYSGKRKIGNVAKNRELQLQLLGRLQPFPALALSLFFCTLTSLTVESVPHRNSPQRNLYKKLSFPWRVPMSDNVYLKHTTLNVLIKVIDSQFIVKTFHIV